jgi:translation initiation factor 4E
MAAVAANPTSPVPLDTIPISPEGTNGTAEAKGDTSGETITVFHDKDNFNVKHPLAHKWTLWFTKPPSGKGDNWADLLKEVITFETVEEFWGIYVRLSHLYF